MKYQRSGLQRYSIRKSEFGTKTQFLSQFCTVFLAFLKNINSFIVKFFFFKFIKKQTILITTVYVRNHVYLAHGDIAIVSFYFKLSFA